MARVNCTAGLETFELEGEGEFEGEGEGEDEEPQDWQDDGELDEDVQLGEAPDDPNADRRANALAPILPMTPSERFGECPREAPATCPLRDRIERLIRRTFEGRRDDSTLVRRQRDGAARRANVRCAGGAQRRVF